MFLLRELLDRIGGKFGSSLFFTYKLGTRVSSGATLPSTQDMQYGRISLSRDLPFWSKCSMTSHHHPESLRRQPVLKTRRKDFSTLLLIRMLRSEDWLVHHIFPYVGVALALSVSVWLFSSACISAPPYDRLHAHDHQALFRTSSKQIHRWKDEQQSYISWKLPGTIRSSPCLTT